MDWIGLNFVPGSRRRVDPDLAHDLAQQVGGRIPLVGVFADQPLEEIESVLHRVPLDAVQLHGSESPEFCTRLDRPVWKVFHVGKGWDPGVLRPYAGVATYLFDTALPGGGSGGAGVSFDWSLMPANPPHPWFLAGGLGISNVANAINLLRPDGIDLNSGVESSVGVKDPARLEAIMEIVSVWRTQAVVVGLPGRPGEGVAVENEIWPCWSVSTSRESPEIEIRGLLDLLAIHRKMVLDLRQRAEEDFQSLTIELMHWQMIAREGGGRLKFRLPDAMVEAALRNSLSGLIDLVD